MAVESRARSVRRSSSAAAGGEWKLQGRLAAAPGQGYFTAGLAALFLCLTALLVFLPLVLPPLPPPPPVLVVVVPVGLAGVLLALALVTADGRVAGGVAPSCL